MKSRGSRSRNTGLASQRLRHGAQHDLAARCVTQHAPSEPERRGDDPWRLRHARWRRLRAEHQLTRAEDRVHQRAVRQIQVARDAERHLRRRRDIHVMPLDDVVERHEAVEDRIVFLFPARACRVAAEPANARAPGLPDPAAAMAFVFLVSSVRRPHVDQFRRRLGSTTTPVLELGADLRGVHLGRQRSGGVHFSLSILWKPSFSSFCALNGQIRLHVDLDLSFFVRQVGFDDEVCVGLLDVDGRHEVSEVGLPGLVVRWRNSRLSCCWTPSSEGIPSGCTKFLDCRSRSAGRRRRVSAGGRGLRLAGARADPYLMTAARPGVKLRRSETTAGSHHEQGPARTPWMNPHAAVPCRTFWPAASASAGWSRRTCHRDAAAASGEVTSPSAETSRCPARHGGIARRWPVRPRRYCNAGQPGGGAGISAGRRDGAVVAVQQRFRRRAEEHSGNPRGPACRGRSRRWGRRR